MRISDWSSDVCSSDLTTPHSAPFGFYGVTRRANLRAALRHEVFNVGHDGRPPDICLLDLCYPGLNRLGYHWEELVGTFLEQLLTLAPKLPILAVTQDARSEEHTSELQSLMRISYAVFCLKKKKTKNTTIYIHNH